MDPKARSDVEMVFGKTVKPLLVSSWLLLDAFVHTFINGRIAKWLMDFII